MSMLAISANVAPGAMAEALPGEHLFLQGAIGGWVQPVKGERTFALAERYGASLAEAAREALASAEPALQPRLEFRRQPFEIALENPGFLPSADYLTATSVGPQAAPRMLQALEALTATPPAGADSSHTPAEAGAGL